MATFIVRYLALKSTSPSKYLPPKRVFILSALGEFYLQFYEDELAVTVFTLVMILFQGTLGLTPDIRSELVVTFDQTRPDLQLGTHVFYGSFGNVSRSIRFWEVLAARRTPEYTQMAFLCFGFFLLMFSITTIVRWKTLRCLST